MKKYYFLIVLALILGLVLTGCSLLSNVGQVPSTEQKGMPFPTAANLVALWHLDGNANDSTGNGNDGTLKPIGSEPTWESPGKFGGALSFDGSDDYVEVYNSTSLKPSNITVECWVRGNNPVGNYRYIVAKSYVIGYASYGHQR